MIITIISASLTTNKKKKRGKTIKNDEYNIFEYIVRQFTPIENCREMNEGNDTEKRK